MNALFDGLRAMNLTDKEDEVVGNGIQGLENEIDKLGFKIFKPIADFGFFGWKQYGSYRSVTKVTTEEIRRQIKPQESPPTAVSIAALKSSVPMAFANLVPQEYENKYPYQMPPEVSVCVAKSRGLDVHKEVDFLFGGSTLNVLATHEIPSNAKYLVALVPKTNVIVIKSDKEYTADLSAPGFQFERLVTGQSIRSRHDDATITHLHLMEVGRYRVLFGAETDAIDKDGDPVEVKASNPRYWGTKVMFQMISSGSLTLYQGKKYRGQTLQEVWMRTLSSVGTDANLRRIEKRILANMEELAKARASLKEGKVFRMAFHGSKLTLKPFSPSFLMPAKVTEQLLQSI